MDIKEAIEYLLQIADCNNEKEIETIIEVLEKADTKKPIDIEMRWADLYGYCPICYEGLDGYDLYCNRCGQKIDWGLLYSTSEAPNNKDVIA